MKEVNLEEILCKEANDIVIYLESYDFSKKILAAMKEACKQTLELAAENATAKVEIQWSGNTGSEYCDEYAVVDKQSILNIINQIK